MVTFPAAALASPAQPIPAELEAYVSLPAHNLTTGALIGQQAASIPPCKSDTARYETLSVFKPVKFDASGRKPIEGMWKETWKVDGCDGSGLFNVLVGIAGPGKMQLAPLPPGPSLADPLLQRSAAIQAATVAVKLGPADCKASRIIDTRVLPSEGKAAGGDKPAPADPAKPDAAPGTPTHSWKEEWLVDVCGVHIIAPLRFTPELTGVSVKAMQDEARKKSPEAEGKTQPEAEAEGAKSPEAEDKK